MDKWTRLTPEDDDGGSGITLFYHYGGAEYHYPYGISADGAPIRLSPAELLALATVTEVWRRVPEVVALAAAVGNIYDALEADAAPYEVDAALRLVKERVTIDPILLFNLMVAFSAIKEAK